MVWLLWKTHWWFLTKLNTEFSHDLTIPLLDIYPGELKALKNICAHKSLVTNFTETLFIIVPNRNNPEGHQLMNR